MGADWFVDSVPTEGAGGAFPYWWLAVPASTTEAIEARYRSAASKPTNMKTASNPSAIKPQIVSPNALSMDPKAESPNRRPEFSIYAGEVVKGYLTDRVTSITGLSRMTIYRLERAGMFSARRNLTKNSVAWLEDIREWIRSRPSAPLLMGRRASSVAIQLVTDPGIRSIPAGPTPLGSPASIRPRTYSLSRWNQAKFCSYSAHTAERSKVGAL